MTPPPVDIVAISIDKLIEVVAVVLAIGLIVLWVQLVGVGHG